MSITRINHFEAKENCVDALFTFMSRVVAIIQKADGCLSCRLLQGAENKSQLVIIEEWVSIAHHQAAASIIPATEIAQASALFSNPPFGIYYQN